MTDEILIIGAGSIGSRHARNLRAVGSYMPAIYDTDTERAKALTSRIGGNAYGNLEDALKAAPQGVMVCSPPSLHIEHAAAALQSGAAVFIEKPVAAHTGPELDRLIATAKARNVEIMVGFNLRFNRCIRRARDIVTSGLLGDLLHVEAVFGQYLPDWRPGQDYRNGYITRSHAEGGGVIHDVAAHEIDYLTWIAGEVRSISCMAGKTSNLEMLAEDTAEITLQFASGAIGRVHADCTRPGYTRRCELIGSDGMLSWDYHAGLALRSKGSADWQPLEPPADPDEAYVLELAQFVSMIESGAAPDANATAGRRVLGLIEAAQDSAERGTARVLK